ncbi:hypothetical protein NDU88_002736 [Pleurodeles waltl]|uniref:Uncharacterized protein n=1 Tax=Pleurodeles waltl TaxID=8319 RepID=A0AAV7NP08_PLEWA|nr:hypothetical protein NDU88_002736 [Pleurodeles waltl]
MCHAVRVSPILSACPRRRHPRSTARLLGAHLCSWPDHAQSHMILLNAFSASRAVAADGALTMMQQKVSSKSFPCSVDMRHIMWPLV